MKRITVVLAENYRGVRERCWTFGEAEADLDFEFDGLAAKLGPVISAVPAPALMKGRS